MSITDKMFDGITKVIRMDGRVESLASTVKEQQVKIENLSARVIRLETALEITLATQGVNMPTQIKQIESPSLDGE